MSKPKLSRRTLLRGAGGVALGLPLLEAMVGGKRAHAQSAPVRRLIIYQFPNGLFLPDWFPQGRGTSWSPSLLQRRQAEDPSSIQYDLASIRQDINIVTGLSNSRFKVDAHTSTNGSFLTCTADRQTWRPTGPSIDEIASATLGVGRQFPALRLSVYQNLTYGDMSTSICFGAGGQPLQPRTSPRSLYSAFTGLVAAPGGASPVNFNRDFRLSVLDFVRADLDRVRGACGVGDRQVLDQHFQSVREIEQQLSTLQTVQCELPDLSAQLGQLSDPPAGAGGHWPNTDHAALLPLRSEVLQRLGTLALRCDLTRVLVISMGPSSCRMNYPFLGMGNTDDHFYSHLQQDPGSRDKQLQWNRLTRWKLSEFARLINLLKVPDGTGASLLDGSVVVCGSELANGAGHSVDLLPIVVAGNLGPMANAAQRNQHLVQPCNPSAVVFQNPGTGARTTASTVVQGTCTAQGAYTPLANLWLTAFRALGVPQTSFGDATGTLSGLWV